VIVKTAIRAISILKFEKNTYKEISLDQSSIYGSGIIIILSSLANTSIFKIFVQPSVPLEIPFHYLFITWILFNWIVLPLIIVFIIKTFNEHSLKFTNKNLVAISFIGYSNTAEILKILIILFPNFIVFISWSALMLVLASQALGVKQIYNIKSMASAIGVIIASYFILFFSIILIFVLFSRLGNF